MRVLPLALVIALALAPGCSCGQRGSLTGERDGGAVDAVVHEAAPRDGGPRDGGVRDGLAVDAGTCDPDWMWRLERRAVAGVELLAGTAPRMGVADRLRVRVWLDARCEVLGRVDLEPLDIAACCVDGWQVTAWVWIADGCQPEDGPSATWIVTIGGRDQHNEQVFITANPASDPVLLEYTREGYSGPEPPYPLCGPETPPGSAGEGAACATDCDCAAGLTCIGFFAGVTGAPTWMCLRPCNDLLDCGGEGACADFVEGPARVCGEGDQCTGDGDCPPGFYCLAGDDHSFCLDNRPFVTGEGCTCDRDCLTGQRCLGGFGVRSCEIFCQRDIDCPHDYSQIAYECGTGSVCVPLGD